MTDVALIASVAAGASAVLGGGVGAPIYFRGKKRKLEKAVAEWHEHYYSWKNGLEEIVMNGVTPSRANVEARNLIRLISQAWPVLKGYERSESVRISSYYGHAWMGLTYIYRVDGGLEKPIAIYCPTLGLDGSDMSKYISDLLLLIKTAALVEPKDPWVEEEYCQFLQEYAAHLLLNFRPSPETDSRRDAKKDAEGIRRQKALNTKAVELRTQAQDILDRQVEDVDKVASSSLEAAKASIQQARQSVEAAKENPVAVVPQVGIPASESVEVEVPTGLLREDEQSVVDGFLERSQTLVKEQQVSGQQAIEKLLESATLYGKAHHFSDATKVQVLSIAEENRALAVSELVALMEQTAPAEELEALYTLRVSNKYLSSRHNERVES